jgi:hypothetical protein
VKLTACDKQPMAKERWSKVLEFFAWTRQQQEMGADPQELVPAFISCFIDDYPMISIAGFGRAVLAIFAALLDVLGLDPQMKKVLPEGDFTQQGVVMGVYV